MARIFIDGFESGVVSNLWSTSSSPPIGTVPATYGMSGSYYGNFGHGDYVRHDFPSDYTSDLYFSFRIRQADMRTGIHFYLHNGDGEAIVLYKHDTDGLCHPTIDIIGIAGYQGTLTLQAGDTYRVEIRIKSDYATSGLVQVKINGILDIDRSGIKTCGYTNDAIKSFLIRGDGATKFDDIVVDDSTWVGNTRIQGITPSADTTCAWTAVPATNHYANINEIPWRSDSSDAEYVYTDATGIIDLFGCTNLVDSTAQPIISIKSVQISTRAKLVGDATNVPHLKLGVQPAGSGTIYYSSNHNIQQDTWATFTSIWSTNPAGGNWDMTTVNNMNIAIKSDG